MLNPPTLTDGGENDDIESTDDANPIYHSLKSFAQWVLSAIAIASIQAFFGDVIVAFIRREQFISGLFIGTVLAVVIVSILGITLINSTTVIEWHGLERYHVKQAKKITKGRSWTAISYTIYIILLILSGILYSVLIQYIAGFYIFLLFLMSWAIVSSIKSAWLDDKLLPKFIINIPENFDKYSNKKKQMLVAPLFESQILNSLLLAIGLGFVFVPQGDIETFQAIIPISVPILIGGVLPDIDVAFGKHRKTTHNIFIVGLFILYPLLFNNLQYIWIGILSHLIIDITGTVRGIALFYPLSDAEYRFQTGTSNQSTVLITVIEIITAAIVFRYVI